MVGGQAADGRRVVVAAAVGGFVVGSAAVGHAGLGTRVLFL